MMRISERSIAKLILLTPLFSVLLVVGVATYLYVKRIRETYHDEQQRNLKAYIATRQLQSENWIKQTVQMLEYEEAHLEVGIRSTLKSRVDLAYDTALYIHEKYQNISHEAVIQRHIVDSLRRMVWEGTQRNSIRITDYQGNTILSAEPSLPSGNIIDFVDADGRAIVLEQIQTARKRGAGFIKTRWSEAVGEEIHYVRNFGPYEWFFGSAMAIEAARSALKKRMIEMIRSFPNERSGFIAVLEQDRMPYRSGSAERYIDAEMRYRMAQEPQKEWFEIEGQHAMVHVKHFEPFGWTLVYGFEHSGFDTGLIESQKRLERRIDQEMLRIIFGAFMISLVSIVISLMISRHTSKLFLLYQRKLRDREQKLRELNASLEERIKEALFQHQEKEKMLIQQSKMAEMGDMISMIAHQWRQPLNQLSYVFMNIEGAYEYKELTPQYMEDKLREGTRLLEFMSQTIDDFRNYFRPDKARSQTTLSEVLSQTLPLIEQTFEVDAIALHVSYASHTSLELYRNELMQVVLNLLKNAKEVLIERDVAVPIVRARSFEEEEACIIEVCDNAGGIGEEILPRIFDPYFSTKSASQGTGLGLYMSKTIVEGHLGGRLEAYNDAQGACFRIVVPKHRKD
ncbi:MAG: cache domain-containing protein [Campylobacterales bacterium]|nr:cache domain-containing protein [Campylobacterales bacterium]